MTIWIGACGLGVRASYRTAVETCTKSTQTGTSPSRLVRPTAALRKQFHVLDESDNNNFRRVIVPDGRRPILLLDQPIREDPAN